MAMRRLFECHANMSHVTTRHNTSQYSTQNTTEYDRIRQVFWVFWVFWNILGSIWLLFCCGILWLVCLTWAVAASPNSRVPRSFIRSSLAAFIPDPVGWATDGHGRRGENWMEIALEAKNELDENGWKMIENLWTSMKHDEDLWRFVQNGVKLYATVKVYRMIVGGMCGKDGIMRQLGGRPVHAAAKRNRSRWHRVTRGQAPQVSLPLVAPGAPALFEAPVLPVLPSVASVASVARVALVAPRGAAPIALALVASVASVAAVVAQVAPVALWPAWLALEAGLGPPPCATSKRGNDLSQLKRSNFSIHFYRCLTYLYRLTACNSQFINFTEHRAVMQKVTVWHEMPWLMWQVMALRHFKKSWHMLRSFAHVWTRYISGHDFYDVNDVNGVSFRLFFEATQLLLFLLEANVLAVEPAMAAAVTVTATRFATSQFDALGGLGDKRTSTWHGAKHENYGKKPSVIQLEPFYLILYHVISFYTILYHFIIWFSCVSLPI